MSNAYTVALCGNPNCGKTTLFNLLTGARHEVGNWPGVTVEKKFAEIDVHGTRLRVVDLPGTYSLDVADESVSIDEKIARDYIESNEADLIINIVDAANIERNLYLTTQLLESGRPLLVILNMMDVAQKEGIQIDVDELSLLLGCPVLAMSATKSRHANELKEKLVERLTNKTELSSVTLELPPDLTPHFQSLCEKLASVAEQRGLRAPWLALRVLEDPGVQLPEDLKQQIDVDIKAIRENYGEELDIVIADARYNKILSWTEACVRRGNQISRGLSARLDSIFLHKYLGIPIFLLITYLMFMFTINFGGAFIDFFDIAVGAILVDGASLWLADIGFPDWLITVLAKGVGGGIQVVSTFIPIIATLYLFLAVLEDTGYLARGAFVMDRFMQSIGLPGKSFIPLMVGLGCTVPAVYATRSLEYHKDRLMTVMMSPFISCGARLPVYILFAAAFFPESAQNIVFSLYLIGIAVAIATGLMLKHTLLKGENTPFVMELPPYHIPHIRNVLIKTWEKLRGFILGAGKLIVAVVVCLSFLNSLGTDGSFGNENSEKSVLTSIGKGITPVFEPMGISEDNWPATVGIFTGLFAKEVVVGTIDALYSSRITGLGESDEAFSLQDKLQEAVQSISDNLADLTTAWRDPVGLDVGDTQDLQAIAAEQEVSAELFAELRAAFNGELGAFAYLLFILLYSPCVSALGAIYKETGTKWTAFTVLWTTFLAYSVATLAYQIGTFTQQPLVASSWIVLFAALHFLNFLMLKRIGTKSRSLLSVSP